MHARMSVEAVGQLSVVDVRGLARARSRSRRVALEVTVAEFALADLDAPGQRSIVIANAVVGNFDVMTPAVDEDAAAALGTIGDNQPIDARRVAVEVAGEWIGHII